MSLAKLPPDMRFPLKRTQRLPMRNMGNTTMHAILRSYLNPNKKALIFAEIPGKAGGKIIKNMKRIKVITRSNKPAVVKVHRIIAGIFKYRMAAKVRSRQ